MSENTQSETNTTTSEMVDSKPVADAAPNAQFLGAGIKDADANQAVNTDDQPKGEGHTDEDAKPKGEVPEVYEFKAPEGLELNKEAVAEFTPIAKELNLTNEQAQKLVDIYGGQILKAMKANEEAQAATINSWIDATKTDKEIGGAEFSNTLLLANNALEKLATPELRQLMLPPSAENPKGLGLGAHPEVIRHFYRIGKNMAEDQRLVQGGNVEVQPERARVMFPTMA